MTKMKITIFKMIDIAKLKKSIPPQFSDLLPKFKEDKQLSVLLFLGDKVILSNQTKRGITKLGETNFKKLAIGYEFTLDSYKLLKEHNFEVVLRKEIFWTDERYIEITQNLN